MRAGLIALLTTLKEINPGIRVVLTVSPVPLIATYEPRSVLVSTSYSKAVLRVAADEALRRFDWVDYFPSYEIITGSFSGGLYYEDDHREVNRLGVAHAMRCFVANFVEGAGQDAPDDAPRPPVSPRMAQPTDIVCDEETLDALRF
ncbi:GSCFA domain-containing protein [Sphingomonas arantia]|uniref:GSCFA domain-containing protein n=1 Tax=Sphingomonas arantia TaxID=1460676 RepID=A0ABW4U2C4_9SPHN